MYNLGNKLPSLICCYHPSRQNTQTGRLTKPNAARLPPSSTPTRGYVVKSLAFAYFR